MARLIDGEARRLRQRYEDEVAEPEQQAYAKIAEDRNRLAEGREVAPDATFTLRLAFGVVKGYRADGGPRLPPPCRPARPRWLLQFCPKCAK
jgi:hypothetical protein